MLIISISNVFTFDNMNTQIVDLKQQIEIDKATIEELNTTIEDKDKQINKLNKQIEKYKTENDTKTNSKTKTKVKKTSAVAAANYRLTSYWANDGYQTGSCTGTGLCEKDFQVNDKGWYTYQGKLVMATATPYLLKYDYAQVDGINYYKYYDTLTVTIEGADYDAIILDSCGACMKRNILDLFVSNKQSAITTNNIVVS